MREALNTLSPERRALLALRLGRRNEQVGNPLPFAKLAREGDINFFPLSFAQQRLWFLAQLEPDSAAYNISFCMQMKRQPDLEALEKSLTTLIRRHETLRTTFSSADGEPVQVIHSGDGVALTVVDLTALPELQKLHEAWKFVLEQRQQPFDLASGPLWSSHLVSLSESDHLLLLTIHHIICDGWSIRVLREELSALYLACSSGRSVSLPDLPLQYADFSIWQREWLKSGALNPQVDYWTKQLDAIPTVLNLPTDRPRSAVQTTRGATRQFEIDPGISAQLKALSRREGVTLYMTVLAAFKALLYRYTGEEDIVIGTPIAGRRWVEIERVIGFFANTLVLRTNLAGQPRFRELLHRLHRVAVEAYANQDLPFERLVELLNPDRAMSHTPLFQVMFIFESIAEEVNRLGGLSPLSVEGDNTAKFDLTLSVSDTGPHLVGSLNYNVDLFDASTVARMAEHLRLLLSSIIENPDQAISGLPLLTQAESHQLIVEWNNTGADFATDTCLHHLFEAQVRQTPRSIAVVFGRERLTYAELNRRANQLARHLRRLGAGPEALVGVCMERSIEMVVALLAVLKAGSAYVPLDPTYPQDRLAFMIEDANASLVITQEQLAGLLPSDKARIICMDAEWESLSRRSGKNLAVETSPGNLAYVIYTSGSTGRPKGAMNTHRGICNRLLWMQAAYGLTGADRVLQKTPYSFDVSVWEFFWPLMVGARLVVARPGGHQDVEYLVATIAGQEITTLHFVPSMLRVFLETPNLERCAPLRRVICSGEALPFELQQSFFSLLNAELHNLYGPTEAAVDVTYWACRSNSVRNVVPIGRPIANTQIYLLDGSLNPVPPGVAGELYIGGAAPGRGYWNQPELTAEKFIPDPFGLEPGARLYRTGDLARHLADGNIEFLGRLDHQVKINGLRIELGEIEAALGKHPLVSQCLIIAAPDQQGHIHLIAYVVSAGVDRPTADDLRRFLSSRLPRHMIPSRFVMLDELPLTHSGKIDRKRLPPPGLSQRDEKRAAQVPRDITELKLLKIWEEVLNVQGIDPADNFFELGGHSLLAVRLMVKIKNELGVELPLSTIFKGATIEHLAQTLRQGSDAIPWSRLVAIQPRGSKPPFFCIHPIGGQVLHFYHLAHFLGRDYPFYAIQAEDLTMIADREDEPARLEQIAAEYIETIRAIEPDGPYHLGGHSFGGIVAFEMAQQLLQQGRQVNLLVMLDTPAPRASFASRREPAAFDDAMILAGLAQDFAADSGKPLRLSPDDLRGLESREQLKYVLQQVAAADLLPEETTSDAALPWLSRILAGFKKRSHAVESYIPQPYDGRITLFRAMDEVLAAATSAHPLAAIRQEATYGWNRLSREPVEVYEVPGHHQTITKEPHARLVADILRQCVDRTAAASAEARADQRS
jgi:amino acid adenylation domain-containing protein